ncbi:hypothetical protein LCGC14_2294680, partial [marine sediment metagenome]
MRGARLINTKSTLYSRLVESNP